MCSIEKVGASRQFNTGSSAMRFRWGSLVASLPPMQLLNAVCTIIPSKQDQGGAPG